MSPRRTLKEIQNLFTSKNCTYLEKNYTYNKHLVKYKCRCGNICSTVVARFRQGKEACKKCASEKQRRTCMERYGVPNAMQSSEIQEKGKKTMVERYGVENASQSKELTEKKKITSLQRYGVEYHIGSKEVQAKIRETNKRKRGVDCAFQDPDVKKKIKQTLFQNYGVEHPGASQEIRKRISNTMMKKYGVKNAFQSEECKEKARETSMKKYGVSHPMQHPDVQQRQLRASFQFKEYKLPSGNTISYQGYENFLLSDLLNENIPEADIILGHVNKPSVPYEFETKQRMYFPDMYIKKSNTIYEVKSEYTYESWKEETHAKMQACVDHGYNAELRVYDKKGKIIIKNVFEAKKLDVRI